MMRAQGIALHKEYTVKALVALCLIATLAGCATQGKTDQQIFTEAATAHVASLPSGAKIRLHSTKIPSKGMFGDTLAIALAGDANGAQLKQDLLNAKSQGDSGFLIMGASSSVDVAIADKAFEGLDLKGMTIYYSGSDAQKDKVRSAVEKTQAQFHFISAQ